MNFYLSILISIMTEKSFKYEWQPHIVAIGRPTGALKAFTTPNNRLQLRKRQEVDKTVVTSPSSFSCSNNILSVIDQKGSLWIVGNIFYEPVNISEIVRIKAKKVFLGEGQLLFETKRKTLVLVTWGSKPEFKNQKLRKIHLSTGQYSHLIDAFFVEENVQQQSLWYYSAANKLEYTVKLYLLNAIAQEIVGFPSGKTLQIPSRPAGMSLGRYHGLIWTEEGRIFGWGCKNLGLGLKVYTKSFYEDLQEIQLPEPIIKACALTSYSIALGSSGQLYEWGIKSDGEPQLTPKLLQMSGLSFIDIKNTDQCIAGLTSTNQLYLWGKGLCQIIGEDKGVSLYLIPKEESTKITDFQLQENFIVLMLTEDKGDLSSQELLSKVTNKWLPHKAKSKPLGKYQKHYLTPTCTPPSAKQNQDFIDRLVGEKIRKETYFCQLQNQQELFKKLMNDSPHQFIYQPISGKPLVTSRQIPKPKRTHKKVQSTRDTCNIAFDFQNANRILKQFDNERNRLKGKGRRLGTVSSSNHKLSSYDERKQAAAERREEIMKTKVSSAVSKRRTMLRSEEVRQLEQEDPVKSFQDKIIQAYILKLIKEPLLYAKHIKLKQRRSQQTFNKIASNMKNILGRQRAIHFLKLLQEEHPQRYELMKRIIGGAMRRWKENKIISIRKAIVTNLVISTLKKKISYGLAEVWLKARKIGKAAKWLVNDNHQRYSHLRSLWKKTLLLYVKPTPSFENKNPSSCRQELNLKTFTQKVKSPKLQAFLHKSVIFHLKLPFAVPLVRLQETKQMCQLIEPQFHATVSIKKGVSWAQSSRLDWKSSTFQRDEKKSTHFAQNGMIDILLYSHHYDFFFKPKNYQLNIPDNMKLSEQWVTEQKTIFESVLKGIMHEQWKQYWYARIQYQMKLAIFIRDNYDYLAEFRWKYILQYNQMKKNTSVQNHKKQRELSRILRLIGAEAILAKDVIPEKHRTLDFVANLKGAPVAPAYQTYLGNSLFKKQFKNYYEQVLAKAKQIRRFFS